jgi:ankyrin repeat protein
MVRTWWQVRVILARNRKGEIDLDEPGSMGFTALHWAANMGSDEIVLELLEAGATVDTRLMQAPAGGNMQAGLQCAMHVASIR